MIELLNRVGAGRVVAAGNAVVALVLALGVFRLLPVRSRWVTVPAIVVIALLVVSAVGLVQRARWAGKLARVAGLALLWGGLLGIGTLTLGLTFSRAVVASTAGPGPLVIAFSILLLLPYTVVYATALLVWARGQAAAAGIVAPPSAQPAGEAPSPTATEPLQ